MDIDSILKQSDEELYMREGFEDIPQSPIKKVEIKTKSDILKEAVSEVAKSDEAEVVKALTQIKKDLKASDPETDYEEDLEVINKQIHKTEITQNHRHQSQDVDQNDSDHDFSDHDATDKEKTLHFGCFSNRVSDVKQAIKNGISLTAY